MSILKSIFLPKFAILVFCNLLFSELAVVVLFVGSVNIRFPLIRCLLSWFVIFALLSILLRSGLSFSTNNSFLVLPGIYLWVSNSVFRRKSKVFYGCFSVCSVSHSVYCTLSIDFVVQAKDFTACSVVCNWSDFVHYKFHGDLFIFLFCILEFCVRCGGNRFWYQFFSAGVMFL